MKHINIQMKDLEHYRYFKSAVAFFFLFFLQGTSIGNGQQGISYNEGVYEGHAMTVPNVEVHISPIELRHRSFCKYLCCM